MNISFQDNGKKDQLVAFNVESFPEREKLNKKIINFRYYNELHQGEFYKNNVIAVGLDGSIIAQLLYHPANYFLDNAKYQMEWSFDLFVRPDMRQESLGLHLFEFIKANKKELPIFASGIGEKALKIEKFYGYHVIGHLKKYVKIVNPLFAITGLMRKKYISKSKFPNQIKGKTNFVKVNFEDLWDAPKPYNSELLEFERDKTFLQWRFFSPDFEYVVYKQESETNSNKNPNYFVVRTAKMKGITFLILVDYRYEVNNSLAFQSIIEAAHKIANQLFLPIVVTGSSHLTADQVLEAAKYKANGRDRPIICNKKEYKKYKETINNRTFVLTTLADTDGEYLL